MTATVLDDQERIKQIDPTGMLKWTAEFADHWRDTYRRAREATLPVFEGIDNVILCGMGGSAIAGDFLRSYLSMNSTVPFEICRNYRLPGYASPRTLVILSSYSGTTEETISAYKEALKRKCQVYTISTGTEKDILKRMAG
ncbi:MAG: SIS domain-containing protein, partial [bacterium]